MKKEIENLFVLNFNLIETNKYTVKKQLEKNSTFHSKKQLPKSLNNWNININQFKKISNFKNKNYI